MAERSAETILERRRMQNREAQRRFREKKSLQKTLDWLQLHGHPYGNLNGLLHSSSPPDSSFSFSSRPFPDTVNTDIVRPTRSWDPTSDVVFVDGNGLFEYNCNTPDDAGPAAAASQLPTLPTRHFNRTSYGHTDISRGVPTPDASVGTSSIERLSSLRDPSLSPRNAGPGSPDESPTSPTSISSMNNAAAGWLSPLHIAARKGSSRIVRMLLQHNTDCNELDSEGLTPLIHAVMEGHEEVTMSLLEYGARIDNNPRDGKRPRPSAIHWAVLKRREGVLRILLDHSSDTKLIDSYDDQGRAPLHIAIDIEFDAGVSLLLQFGADPSQRAQTILPRYKNVGI